MLVRAVVRVNAMIIDRSENHDSIRLLKSDLAPGSTDMIMMKLARFERWRKVS